MKKHEFSPLHTIGGTIVPTHLKGAEELLRNAIRKHLEDAEQTARDYAEYTQGQTESFLNYEQPLDDMQKDAAFKRVFVVLDEAHRVSLLEQCNREAVANDSSRTIVQLPPGHRISRITKFILTPCAYRRYVAPLIADMQFEYIDALAQANLHHAQWIRIRGYILILWGLARTALTSFAGGWLRSKR